MHDRHRPYAPLRPSALVAIGVLATSLAPVATPAQAPRALGKPDAEFSEPFTSLTGVRELRDGRVVAIDARDKIIQMVDFKAGTGTKVAREGSGPGEYAFPSRLVPLPGDSSGVYDMLNSRLLVVLPDGKAGPFITIERPSQPGPGGGTVRIGGSAPRYADAKGRLYWTGQAFSEPRPGQPPKVADSLPILRYDRGTRKIDTLAWVRPAKENVQTSGGGGRMEVRMGVANPFSPRDEWGVAPDGRVVVLRAPEYRVEWYGPAGKGATASIPFSPIKVTEKHKQEWRDSRKQATALMVTVENGRQSVRTGPPPADAPDPGNWPELLPPFLENSVYVAPNGEVRVNRTRQAGDDVAKYDVLDANAKVVKQVALPKKTRLVGLGNGTAYVVRIDEDDLQYLQRYRVP